MSMLRRLSASALLLAGLVSFSTVAPADPATRNDDRIEKFGYWYVIKKPATYIVAGTGQRGRYTLCSAVLFAKTASLEFEAKNDKAWAFYVAKQAWAYPFETRKLTLKSGSQQIQIPAALYGGSMISGMSHNLMSGSRISMEKLRSFISQGAPISFYDNNGKMLLTFPNDGDDLVKAFDQAIRCSLANAPK